MQKRGEFDNLMKYQPKSFTATAILGCSVAFQSIALSQAQPQTSGAGQPMLFQPMTSDTKANYQTEFTHSFRSDLNRGDQSQGDFSASRFGLDYSRLFTSSETYTWGIGAGWDYAYFDLPTGVPVPDTFQSTYLRLSNQWRFADNWSLRTDLRPGIYSDFQDISGGDFNMPFTAILAYDYSASLTFVAGLNFNYQSDVPFIGGPGVIWRFAEGWQLRAVLPKPQLIFSPTQEWMFFVGGELRGITARVAEDFGTTQNNPALNDDNLSYREIRLGAGARYRFHRLFNVTVEGGYAIDRRFQYQDANLLLNGDGAPYVQVSVNGSY